MPTLTIKNRQYAVGLFWQGLVSKHTAAKESRVLALQLRSDMYALRRKGIPQAGFGQKAEGLRSGQYALAAALAELREGSWIGIFPAGPGRMYYFAQRANAIWPEGDVLDTEAAIQQRVQQDIPVIQPTFIYAPESWGLPDSQPGDLAALLGKVRPSVRLQALGNKAPFIPLAVVASLLIGGLGWLYYKQMHPKYPPRPIRPVRMMPALPQAPVQGPWTALARPDAMLAACWSSIKDTPVDIVGWGLSGISCGGGQVSMGWKRRDGTTADLIGRLRGVNLVPGGNGNEAIQTKPLSLRASPGPEPLWPQNIANARVYAIFQAQGIPVTLTPSAPPATAPATPGRPSTAPNWQLETFSFESPVYPAFLGEVLSVPGLRITKIIGALDHDPTKALTWKIEGNLYAL